MTRGPSKDPGRGALAAPPVRIAGVRAGVSCGHDPALPRGAARPAGRPAPAHRRRPLVAQRSARRDGATTPRRTCRAPCSSTSIATWPRRRARAVIPSPPRPTSRRAWPSSGSTTRARSSPTTTRAGPSRRGCGGCSTTSGIATCTCSTAGSRRGRRSAGRSPTEVPDVAARAAAAPGSLVADDRPGGARGAARPGRADRRPRAGTLPGRGRAGRRRGRPHPDGGQPAERRQPRAGRPVPRSGRAARPVRAAGRRARLVLRAAASRRATTRSPCGSPACPIRSSTPGSYSDWTRAGRPVATGDEPGSPRRELGRRPWRPPADRGAIARRRPGRAPRPARRANPIARSPSSATWNPNSETSGPTDSPSRWPIR